MISLDRVHSIGEALDLATIAHKSFPALLEVDRREETARLSFQEYRRRAQSVAVWLRARGVGAGDRVGILMSNQSNWLVSATAIFWCGGIVVPLDYKLSAPDQVSLILHAELALLVTEYSVWNLLSREPRTPEIPVLLFHRPADKSVASLVYDASAALSLDVNDFAIVSRSREDIATIVYSSGTGGSVKGCMLTHENYLEQAESLAAVFPFGPSDRFFSILPTNHAIDFMSGYLIPIFSGGEVIHQRTLRPEFLAWTMKRYEVTHVAMVPLLLRSFQEKIQEKLDAAAGWQRGLMDSLIRVNELATLKSPNHALSSRLLAPIHEAFGGKLRMIFAGGAFVDPALAEFFQRLGLPVVIGYGLTEAGTVLTVNNLKPFRADTVGPPLRGVEIEIRDSDENGHGEVWAKSRTIMAGYFKNEELTAETIINGWLRTGDVGYVDASGHLRLVGRKRNMIVTGGGKNVYPEDIESAFEAIPGCKEFCIFAANYVWPGGTLTTEKLILVIRKDPDTGLDPLPEFSRRNQKLSDYKRADGFLVWDREFPRTASMKIKRAELAQQIGGALDRAHGFSEF